jgi:hypothetical protein
VSCTVLDDLTYTNAAWAQAAALAVEDIHVMEIGFLQRMQYDLFVSAREWSQWRSCLGRFVAFVAQARADEPSLRGLSLRHRPLDLRGERRQKDPIPCDVSRNIVPPYSQCHRDHPLCTMGDEESLIHPPGTEAGAATSHSNPSIR